MSTLDADTRKVHGKMIRQIPPGLGLAAANSYFLYERPGNLGYKIALGLLGFGFLMGAIESCRHYQGYLSVFLAMDTIVVISSFPEIFPASTNTTTTGNSSCSDPPTASVMLAKFTPTAYTIFSALSTLLYLSNKPVTYLQVLPQLSMVFVTILFIPPMFLVEAYVYDSLSREFALASLAPMVVLISIAPLSCCLPKKFVNVIALTVTGVCFIAVSAVGFASLDCTTNAAALWYFSHEANLIFHMAIHGMILFGLSRDQARGLDEIENRSLQMTTREKLELIRELFNGKHAIVSHA